MKLIISIIVLIILCIFYVVFRNQKSKWSLFSIKITNIEEKLNSTLLKRKELIKDTEKVIKDIIKTDKDIYQDISSLDNINNIIELDRKLMTYVNEFYIISTRYKKLKDNTSYQNLYYDILDTEDLLNAYKDYYNDTALKYNKIISTFPFSIAYKVKGKKKKLFFDKKDEKNSVI